MKKQLIFFLVLVLVLGLYIPKITIAASFPSQPPIESVVPVEGAIGDKVIITLPIDYIYYCSADGTWAYFELSANIYFNNVVATTNKLINSYTKGVTKISNRSISVIIPTNATTGKIKVELMCNGSYYHDEYVSMQGIKSIYEEVNYSATLYSPTNFTVLSPAAQDDFSVRQQYLQQIKVDQAWNYTHGSSEVVVAVIDDGIYTGHPDLEKNMWINNDEIEGNGKDDDNNGYIDDRWGWDFVNNSKNMTTLGTHGTMVSGIIGAVGNNDTVITGINWYIKLMPIIACDDYGCNDGAIKKSIKYAVDNGADIINLSLGGGIFEYTDNFNEMIKYAFDRNVLVVIAAGNGDVEGGIGRDLSVTKVSPVCNDGNQNMVLGVGAVGADNHVPYWSNYYGCVDVYAPGVDIISTAVPAYSTLGGFYDIESGTSFSAPMVSGIAALIKAQYPTIKNTAIRDRIINNMIPSYSVVDAYKAISQTFTDSEKTSSSASGPESALAESTTNIDINLSKRMSGNILLQVEKNGEAWYVYPNDNKRYYLGRPADAFTVMRRLGLGAKHDFIVGHTTFPDYVWGKILLDVEQNGEAYYIYPKDKKAYYLGRPEDAFRIMRELGLGITNNDVNKIPEGY